jgi:preprotein translocase subunit Sss1
MNIEPQARARRTRIGAGAAQPPKAEYIYHWNRIMGALAAVVLLIGLVGFAVHAWLSPPSAAPEDAGFDAVDAPAALAEIVPEPGEQDVPGPAPAQAEPGVMAPPDAADLPEPAGPAVIPAPDAESLPDPEEPGITPVPEAATPRDPASPLEQDMRARPEAQETVEGDVLRVYLPPGTRVNLRAAPRLSSPVLRILDPGAELWLLQTADDFYQVRSAEGLVGWVSRDFSSLTPNVTPAR